MSMYPTERISKLTTSRVHSEPFLPSLVVQGLNTEYIDTVYRMAVNRLRKIGSLSLLEHVHESMIKRIITHLASERGKLLEDFSRTQVLDETTGELDKFLERNVALKVALVELLNTTYSDAKT